MLSLALYRSTEELQSRGSNTSRKNTPLLPPSRLQAQARGGGGQGSGANAPALRLPDPPSCQQLSKAGAKKGAGLHSLDILPCGGSWTGPVLLVAPRGGWGMGVESQTEIKLTVWEGWGWAGQLFWQWECDMCSFSVRIPQRADITSQ